MKTLTAFCDLRYTPISYDFAIWLVRAMKERDDSGCDSLHVVIVPYETGLGGFARNWGEHDEAATRWRMWHIVMAMIPLARATVTLAASRKQADEMAKSAEHKWWPYGRAHLAGPLVEAARKGEKIPKLRATDAARKHVSRWVVNETRLVTMTTRCQRTLPDRNSRIPAWIELSKQLFPEFHVVLLWDSHETLNERDGNFAVLDPDLRLALYERAEMNLIGNNGPAGMLWFSDAPFIQFGIGVPENWIAHMAEHVSMKPGDQLPWARPDQRLVWKPDSFDVMREEFDKWAQPSTIAA